MSTKLILLIITCLLLYIIYVLSFSKKERRKTVNLNILKELPQLEVDLELLAKSIWLKHNENLAQVYYEFVEKTPSGQLLPEDSEPLATESTVQDSITEMPATSSPSQPEKEKTTYTFNDQITKQIWEEFVLPYHSVYESQNALPLIKEGLSVLEQKGDCPSLTGVSPGENPEIELEELNIYKEILSKVSLKNHTYHVINISVNKIKTNFNNYENHIPRVVVTALYHDLGKIPEYWLSGGKKAHQYVSANLLSAIAVSNNAKPFWLDEAIQIIREHHIPNPSNTFAKILQEADRKARLLEISQHLSDFSIKPFESWFSVKELLDDLAEVVNEDRFGSKWYAFSFKDIIYVRPEKLVELADEQRKRKKVLCEELLGEKEKYQIVYKILEILQAEKILIEGKTSKTPKPQKFKIHRNDGKVFELHLVPVKMSIYDDNTIKKIKNRLGVTYFSSIVNVTST